MLTYICPKHTVQKIGFFLHVGSLYSWPVSKLPVVFYTWERRNDLHEWTTYRKILMFTHTYQGNVNQMQNTEVEP